MRIKTSVLLLLSVAALAFTGCDGGRAQMEPKDVNVLGIVKVEKDSYQPSEVATIAISSDDLYKRKNFQGDKVTLLWGLVTLKDY